MAVLLACLLWCLQPLDAQAADPVRVGLLQFGTVNWELDVMARHGLDDAHGIEVDTTELSSTNAVVIALQGGAVDVIVSDWLWVNRQRASGKAFQFFPYSLAVGGLFVRPDSGIRSLADLAAGGRLGVAGGPVDKSWLLLQAYARARGIGLAGKVEPSFAAPPLLNRLMLAGDLPAVLNYWHYGARLEAAGMRRLLDVRQMLDGLGVAEPVPMLGWVFSQAWADRHPQVLKGFLEATFAAKRLLVERDDEWQTIRSLTRAEDDATLNALRDGYRQGAPTGLVDNGRPAASKVFDILVKEGGARLVGPAQQLLPDVFWSGADSARLSDRDAAR
ncbi:MAG: hypothetical protein R3E87_08010 [Burkholderiaceae bacterium]